jgi:hypothetical protein
MSGIDMKKKFVIITILTLLITIVISGCNETGKQKNNEEEKFIGTWVNSEIYNGSTREITYIFDSNKTGKIMVSYIGEKFNSSLEWKLVDNKLQIDVFEPTESRLINDYSFSNNNSTLDLIDSIGNISSFNKQ